MDLGADAPRRRHAVADRHRLHRVNRKNGLADAAVELLVPLHVRAQARGHPARGGDDGAAEGLAGLAGAVDLRDHRGPVLAVDGAQRRLVVDRAELVERRRSLGIAGAADGDDTGADVDAERAQQLLRDGPRGDPRRGLARGGALEDVAEIAAVVLHPAGEVDVARPRRVHAPLLGFGAVERPRVHRAAPVVEVAVADHERDRRADGLAAAHAADDLGLVVLDLHPPAAAVAVLPPGQVAVDALAVEADAGRHPGDDDGELRPVRLAGADEAEARHVRRSYRAARA